MIANKDIHTAAQSCITCWILIIPILQGKRLLPYIIVEKTSQRNKIAIFYLPEASGFFIIILQCSEKVYFLWKVPFY